MHHALTFTLKYFLCVWTTFMLLTVPLVEENISGVSCWQGIRQDRLVGVNSQKVKRAIVNGSPTNIVEGV